MRRRPQPTPPLLHAVLPLLLCSLLTCGGTPAAPERYHARGRIETLSGQGTELRAVIRHEAVPRFKGRDGRVGTMASMTMAFGVGPGVSLQGLRAGDKIAFDFEVRWHKEPALLLTRLSRLPAATKLALPP